MLKKDCNFNLINITAAILFLCSMLAYAVDGAPGYGIIDSKRKFSDTWSLEKWTERNSRISKPSSDFCTDYGNNLYSYSEGELPGGKMGAVYQMNYSPGGRIEMGYSYRNESPLPAFVAQYALLQFIAEKHGGQIEVNEIMRGTISNDQATQSLKKDFPKGSGSETANFREMDFFRSPNGLNTLDLIKRMKPESDPFELIREVRVDYSINRIMPDVLISLKAPIAVYKQNVDRHKGAFLESAAGQFCPGIQSVPVLGDSQKIIDRSKEVLERIN